MTSSLVGSEMCIRDRYSGAAFLPAAQGGNQPPGIGMLHPFAAWLESRRGCLLYTSDAADDM
eukprot:7139818-Prorocentrum_lima.AAC.1